MMSFAPSTPDWQWFGSLSDEQLAKYVKSNPDITWLQTANNWIKRSSCNKSKSYNLPPQHYVPVLTTNGTDGQLGFLTVDEKKTYGKTILNEHCEFASHAYDAAKVVFDLFRPLQHHLGDPDVTIYLDPNGGGTSLSLPAMIASLQRLTGICLPNTIVSTGCLTNEKLTPVNPDTLSLKIEAAKRFGYKTLIVVTEQTGIPQECGMEIIQVDSDPLIAILQLINSKLTGVIKKDRHLARLLFSADRLRQLKDNEIKDNEIKYNEIIEPFCNSDSLLVRSVANDILLRNALHQGKTIEADQYRQKIGQFSWSDIPNDYLGHYLRYERFAATSILEIDLGIWDDEHKTHQEVNKRLEHLQNTIRNGYADRNDYFGALALANARALRKCFLARHEQNFNLLESAWKDFIFLLGDWEEIFQYARQRIDKTSTPERQRNYCLECLMDYWKINKCLPKWEKVDEFRDRCETIRFNKNNNNTTYDKIAELNYCVIEKQLPSENNLKQQFIEKCDSLDVTKYPNWILYENILRFEIGNAQQRQHCLEKLTEALPELSANNTSIFILLALRTWQILIDNGIQVKQPLAPSKETQLRAIYDELISVPETLIIRCPY
ncbi:MAG: hypothetical protein LBI18_04990 [Planctomycetaceae bacterium]|jgi:hypothetical protein|nr:hypothetical protein [Planctomycetaceae bacterium]